ncbi:hypothetical protein [Thermococcus prieurii]
MEAVCGTTLELSEGASISFVVTNPHFSNINNKTSLATEVGDLLLKAIAGDISDWSQAQPSNTGSTPVDLGNGVKAVAKFNGTDYCFYSPSVDNWEWKLCSSTGWPVWVKDAKEWANKLKSTCTQESIYDNFAGVTNGVTVCKPNCQPIQQLVSSTYDPQKYSTYLLTVKFGGSECEGLSGYGKAYIEHWQNMMNPRKNPMGMLAYTVACGTTTSVCYAAMTAGTGGIAGALSWGKWIKDMGACAIAPALTGWLASQQIEESKLKAQALFGGSQILGTATIMGVKKALLPTVQIYRLQRSISQASELVKAAGSAEATFDDFVKLGTRYTESAQQFDSIAKKFPRYLAVTSDEFIKNKEADDLLRLLAQYGKDHKPTTLAEIGSKLGIEGAEELAESKPELLIDRITSELRSKGLAKAADEAFKGMDETLRELLKKEMKASFVCGAAGAVAGTLSYYSLVASTSTISTPTITMNIGNISAAMPIHGEPEGD